MNFSPFKTTFPLGRKDHKIKYHSLLLTSLQSVSTMPLIMFPGGFLNHNVSSVQAAASFLRKSSWRLASLMRTEPLKEKLVNN